MSEVKSKRVHFTGVWNKNNVAPLEFHLELQDSFRAADRLAQEHLGHKFIVFQAVSKHYVPGPHLTPCQFCGQMRERVVIAADCRTLHGAKS